MVILLDMTPDHTFICTVIGFISPVLFSFVILFGYLCRRC